MELEKQRIASGKGRVTIFGKGEYDQTNIEDKIDLRYQRFNDGSVMIW